MSKSDGGPAFPVKVKTKRVIKRGDGFESIEGEDCFVGMTLRDYFAIHANEDDIESAIVPGEPLDNPEWRAIARYRHADAMLKEREK